MDMPCNEMEVLSFMSKEIHDVAGGGMSPEDIMSKTKTQFGSKVFSEQDLRCFYNYALMVPAALLRNLSELHFSMIPATRLRCPPKVFHTIAGIDHDGMHPYTKVPCHHKPREARGRGQEMDREHER